MKTVEELLEEIANLDNWRRTKNCDLTTENVNWDPRALAREALALLKRDTPIAIFAELNKPIDVAPPTDVGGISLVIVKVPSNLAVVRSIPSPLGTMR